MKRLLLTAAIVAATLSSCSKNEIDYNLESADNAISFGVYTGINTKAAETTTNSIQTDGFYLFGFYTGESIFSSTASTLNFMYNQEVNYYNGTGTAPTNVSSNSWYYSPVKYWSETETDQYTFFAYAPEVETSTNPIGTLSENTTLGTPYIDFDLTSTTNGLNDMVDFVADACVDVTSGKDDDTVGDESADKVTFLLLHETTRINLTAITNITSSSTDKEEDDTSVVVTKVELSGTTLYRKARYKFSATDDNATTTTNDQVRGNWTARTSSGATLDLTLASKSIEKGSAGINTSKYTATGVEVASGTTTTVDLLGSTAYQFLIPVASTTAPDVTITVTYDIVTMDTALDGGYTVSKDNIKTVTLPTTADNILKQGVAYNLNLEFSLNEVVLTATVDDWDTTNITGSTSVEK